MENATQNILCPLRHTLDIIGGKWKLPILCVLADQQPHRYSDIKKRIPDITNMMLSQSLKELEKYGIIIRRQYNEVPPRVEYTIADNMDELLDPLKMLAQWGATNMVQTSINKPACQECMKGSKI